MTRAQSFKELLQVLGAIREGDYNLYVQLESKFSAVEREFQKYVEEVESQHIKYWQEVVEGKIPKFISLDHGKTFLKLTAIPEKPGPNDKIAFFP